VYDDWDIPVRVKRRRGLSSYGWNNIILIVCTALFFLKILLDGLIDYFLALNPVRVFSMPWQVFTSMFVHAGFGHFFVNMLVLFFMGSELERRVGGNRYLLIFFTSGLAGSLAYIVYAYMTNPYVYAMGASAAIFGVLGALAIIAPEIRVFIFPFPIPISIRVAILLFAFYDLILLPFSYKTGVAHISHLSGLLVGLYFGKTMRFKRYYYGYI
jgi:membrane associated rhomboid family serine protease